MRDVLKKLAPSLRSLGFRGSGQNFRKKEGDFIFVVNFQGSRWGDVFYINLGAQPVFIPAEGDAEPDIKTLKEYECVLRRRVGREWPWQLSDRRIRSIEAELTSTLSEFFGHAQTLRAALDADTPERLIRGFSSGTTEARAALHLARASLALGHYTKTRALANLGLERAGKAASTLVLELEAVLQSAKGKTAQRESAADDTSP